MQLTDQGDYRCRACGETFPLALWAPTDTAIGGLHAPSFVSHGPGCRNQVFDNVEAIKQGRVDTNA